ncbi:hypothetical protein EVAR_56180_1 [Eumeta japonica]|uniref:Uncharacterized protein n=1 Tax=Eumeta variegata TaxID=151549 RepID=A0A4C1ZW04_EUMVA|nr:hypothetical protein EVAR_56180_1 [Eumeta japonica]
MRKGRSALNLRIKSFAVRNESPRRPTGTRTGLASRVRPVKGGAVTSDVFYAIDCVQIISVLLGTSGERDTYGLCNIEESPVLSTNMISDEYDINGKCIEFNRSLRLTAPRAPSGGARRPPRLIGEGARVSASSIFGRS